MPIAVRKLRVFLCHASQDKPIVRELYQRLLAEGWIDPWLDEEKLALGQHWTTAIEEALDAADIVLIFLSRNSVSKEGFVQRELNYAWELSLEKPRNVIFLIPFRLDDCDVPRYLKSRQWGDYFGKKKLRTYKILLDSLKQRHEQKLRLEAEEQVQVDEQLRHQKEIEEKIQREREDAIRKEIEERVRREFEEAEKRKREAEVTKQVRITEQTRTQNELDEKIRLEREDVILKQKGVNKNQRTGTDKPVMRELKEPTNEQSEKSSLPEKNGTKSKVVKQRTQRQAKNNGISQGIQKKNISAGGSFSKVTPKKARPNGLLNSILSVFSNEPYVNPSKPKTRKAHPSQANVKSIAKTLIFPNALTPRDQLKIKVRSTKPENFISCPICGTDVKAKNLIRHYDKHDITSASSLPTIREQFKQFAKSSNPESIIECPICYSRVKAKNLVLHYDRNHKDLS